MKREIEAVELTHSQARELRKMIRRARKMYDDRQGGDGIVRTLRKVEGSLNEMVEDGGGGDLKFSIGMKGERRERIAGIVDVERKMEKRKMSQGWGMDGRKFNALERALDSLQNPEVREVEV